MISFKMNDYNMTKIAKGADFLNQYDIKNYEIIGLKLEGRPHIKIIIPDDGSIDASKLIKFFQSKATNPKKYVCEVVPDEICNKVIIALRRDVREDVKVAKKLMQTIIFLMENKLVIPKDFKLDLGAKVKPCSKNVKKKAAIKAAVLDIEGLLNRDVEENRREEQRRLSARIAEEAARARSGADGLIWSPTNSN